MLNNYSSLILPTLALLQVFVAHLGTFSNSPHASRNKSAPTGYNILGTWTKSMEETKAWIMNPPSRAYLFSTTTFSPDTKMTRWILKCGEERVLYLKVNLEQTWFTCSSVQRIILCAKVRLRITLNFKWLFQLILTFKILFICSLFFNLFFGSAACRISVLQPELEPVPLAVEAWVLTTGPVGKFPNCFFFFNFQLLFKHKKKAVH